MWSLRPNAEANSEAESVMKRLLYPRPDKSSTKKWLKYYVLNFTLQPRALSFNRFRSQPKAFTTGDIYLNWWHTLVFWHFQLPDLKQQFIWFHQRPHNYTPLFSIFNFSCQLLSEIIFFKVTGGFARRITDFYELQSLDFPENNCHTIHFHQAVQCYYIRDSYKLPVSVFTDI